MILETREQPQHHAGDYPTMACWLLGARPVHVFLLDFIYITSCALSFAANARNGPRDLVDGVLTVCGQLSAGCYLGVLPLRQREVCSSRCRAGRERHRHVDGWMV